MDSQEKKIKAMMGAAWESFVRETPDMVFLKDKNFVYISASQAFADLVGCQDPQDIVGKTDFEVFADGELARHYIQDDQRVLEEAVSKVYIEPIPAKNGSPRYALTRKSLIRDDKGDIIGIFGIARDVTFEYESKRIYEREMERLLTLSEGIFAVALLDVTAWRLLQLQCRDPEDPLSKVGDSLEMFLAVSAQMAPDVAHFYQTLDRKAAWDLFNSGRQTIAREYRRRQSDDAYRWMRDEMRFLIEPVSGHLEAVITLRDIEAKKQEQDALRRAAERDAMTGLLHNRAAMRRMKRYLEQEGAGGSHALFIIDLDNFKSINDTFGHRMGDEVILDTASAIRQVFRESDLIGRIGGDEFLVLMKNVGRIDNVRQKGQALVESLQYTCRSGNQVVQLSGSVGISLYRGDGQSLDSLYAKADAALYQVKAGGKNLYLIAGEEMAARQQGMLAPVQHSSAVRLQSLLENMDSCVLVCRVNQDIQFIYASPNTARRMGWDPTWRSLDLEDEFSAVIPQDKETLRQAIFRAVREEESLDCIFRIFSAGGEPRWWRMRGNRLPSREGTGHEMILVTTDITCLKESEEALQFAELRYRTAVEQSDMMLWEVDLRKGTLQYSGDLARRLGLEGRVFQDLPASFLEEGILRPQSEREFCRAMENLFNGNDQEEYTLVAVDRESRDVPVKVHFRLLREEEETPYCAVGVVRPILCESQELELYRKVTQGGVFSVEVLGAPQIGASFHAADIVLVLEYGSRRFYAIHGYTQQSMEVKLHNHCLGCLLPQERERVQQLVGQAFAQGKETRDFQTRIVTEAGELRRIHTTVTFQRKNERCSLSGVVVPVAGPEASVKDMGSQFEQ